MRHIYNIFAGSLYSDQDDDDDNIDFTRCRESFIEVMDEIKD